VRNNGELTLPKNIEFRLSSSPAPGRPALHETVQPLDPYLRTAQFLFLARLRVAQVGAVMRVLILIGVVALSACSTLENIHDPQFGLLSREAVPHLLKSIRRELVTFYAANASSTGCRGPSPLNQWSEESKDAFDRQMVEHDAMWRRLAADKPLYPLARPLGAGAQPAPVWIGPGAAVLRFACDATSCAAAATGGVTAAAPASVAPLFVWPYTACHLVAPGAFSA
jgi:hypothetical protein